MLAIVPSVLSQFAAVADDNANNSNAVVKGTDFWIIEVTEGILYKSIFDCLF